MIQLEYNNTVAGHYGETRPPLRDLLAGYGYSFLRPDDDGELHPATAESAAVAGDDVFAILRLSAHGGSRTRLTRRSASP